MQETYSTYNPTSIPWLPEMPEHWEVRKVKHLFKERSEKGFPDEPLLAATQTKGVVRKEDYETRTVTAQKDFHLLKLVRKEDFVISLRSFQGGIEYAWHQGIISPAYSIFYERKDADTYKGYFKHLFKSYPFINSLTLFVTGIREGQNIDYTAFRDATLPLPPYEEQTAIAHYLDAKTEQINRFIEKKERLIALLKEQKKAFINEILNEGEDIYPTIRVKFVGKVNPTKSSSTLKIDDSDNVVFLPMEKVSENGKIDCSILKPTLELKNGFTFFEKGDIIVAKITPCFENGKGALLSNLLTPYGFGSTEFHTVRAYTKKVNPEYLWWILHSEAFLSLGEYFMEGSAGQKRVPVEFVKNYLAVIPSIQKQNEVLCRIKFETDRIDTTIQRIQTEIQKVKELKQSLIAEVVTGKIKVV
ncbi:hypothetical protein HGH92_01790 [Chitinophaga varians]|uniref:Type I restriction modification DNA specificity domain-containing protein n=1 Tax=Chitinophaga varians TaxID=2202339 RepID=A0A847RIL7_9BACT|nr:restriction endonuclease subunit S [Chitinophaga varians]NLR63026.1 hypothetical protein [Chitinophaga varians]